MVRILRRYISQLVKTTKAVSLVPKYIDYHFCNFVYFLAIGTELLCIYFVRRSVYHLLKKIMNSDIEPKNIMLVLSAVASYYGNNAFKFFNLYGTRKMLK